MNRLLSLLMLVIATGVSQRSFAQSDHTIQDGEYMVYTPTSEPAYVKDGILYYEVLGRYGSSEIIRAAEKPTYANDGVIHAGGEYMCHSSIVNGSLGRCTKSGWLPQ